MDLCARMEIREEADIRRLAAVAKLLIKREIQLGDVFSCHGYSRVDWLHEASVRS
jgi:hypothetical protein